MATDIGVKIGVEGAAQFKSSLQNVNAELRSLSSEMKAATAEFKGNESSAEAVEKKQRILKDTMAAAQKKVELLSTEYEKQTDYLKELAEQLEKAETENGKNSDEANKARAAYEKQETATYKLKDQLNNAKTAMYNAANEEKHVGEEAEDASGKTSRFGDVLKASLTSSAITGALKGIASGIKKVGQFMWNSVKQTGEYADEVKTLATQYNLTTDQVQEFLYMEDLADVSMDTVAGSLSKLTKNMGSAKDGTGAAAEAFSALGVEITNSDGSLRSSNEVFMETIDALGQIANETERDTVAMSIFGKGAQDLNTLVALGADGFQELADKAHDSGAVMSGEALDAANEFKDKLVEAEKKAEALKNQIALKLIPVFEPLIEKALAWAEGIDWEQVGETISDVFNKIATAVENVAMWLSTADGSVKDLFSSLQSLKSSGLLKLELTGGGLLGAVGFGKSRGSYATGYYNVPYDNYPAVLHAGEMVLTASEAKALRSGGGGASVVIYTQQLDNATIDYVVQRVNGALGAMA